MKNLDNIQADYFTFYTKLNSHHLLAQDNSDSQLIAQILMNDSTELVSNIDTEIVAMASEDGTWALTVNKKEYHNALICSPYTTYVTYPLDELKKFDKWWLKILVLINSLVMGLICRATKLNKIVQVNNNLNSLIKHPNCFNRLMPQLTRQLVDRYPKQAITFFRVNDTINKELLKTLRKNGYIVFPDRMAHVFFPDQHYMKRSHTKRDISLLRNTRYTIVQHDDLNEQDAKRISELYQKLFIDKHSKLNPIYTETYFRQAIRYRWHHYIALRNPEGRIDAFISWFYREDVMVCGPLGYDASVDPKVGLYRQLVALCLKHANDNQCIFNMGAGSDKFKSNRGSTPTMEYTAVYCKHLPFYRHMPWQILQWACHKLLKKVIESSSL